MFVHPGPAVAQPPDHPRPHPRHGGGAVRRARLRRHRGARHRVRDRAHGGEPLQPLRRQRGALRRRARARAPAAGRGARGPRRPRAPARRARRHARPRDGAPRAAAQRGAPALPRGAHRRGAPRAALARVDPADPRARARRDEARGRLAVGGRGAPPRRRDVGAADRRLFRDRAAGRRAARRGSARAPRPSSARPSSCASSRA